MDKFALDDKGAGADNGVGRVGYAEEEVFVVAGGYPVVAFVPLLDGWVSEEGWEEGGACRTSSVISPTVVSTLSTSRKPLA